MLLLLFQAVVVGCGHVADPPARVRFLRQVDWATTGVWLKADTHTHSEFSDGAHSVAEVAARAAEYGCDVLAITDHADQELRAGTHEYIAAIEAARRDHPEMVILAGLEWNVPPYGGDEHIVVLFPQTPGEGQSMAEFKARFDDLGREEHDAALADAGLEWLAALGAAEGVKLVAVYEHPSRKRRFANQIVADLRRWRAVNEIVVGFAGAPGHQGMEPLGAYKSELKTISRWDPAAAKVGDAWDTLLAKGVDVWGALAPSDFHDARPEGLADYWPGEFSATWLYAPEKSAQGVLDALRAGTFFGEHGHIVRNVELLVDAPGLPRPAIAGESIEAPEGTPLSAWLRFQTPQTDWSGKPIRIDTVELITLTEGNATSEIEGRVPAEGPALKKTLDVPEHGVVFRARGRHGDLMFYTNPIRVVATSASSEVSGRKPQLSRNGSPAVDRGSSEQPANADYLCMSLYLGLLAMAVATVWRSAVKPAPEEGRGSLAKATPPRRGHYLALAAGFVAFAVYGSLVPLNFQPLALADAWNKFRHLPIDIERASRGDWAANVLLAVPIGFCGLAAIGCDRGRSILNWCGAALVLVMSAVLSGGIEFAQLWFPPRIASLNDVVAQMLGALIGVSLWLILGQPITCWLRGFAAGRDGTSRFVWLLQAYCAVFVIYSLLPLDLTIQPADIWAKYRDGKIVLLPFSGFQFDAAGGFGLLTDAALYGPIGALATVFWRGKRPPRSVLRSFLMGMVLAAGIELGQVLVESRFTDTTQLVTAAVGIVLGAAVMRWHWTRCHLPSDRTAAGGRRFPWLAATVLYGGFLLAYFWAPFDFTSDAGVVASRCKTFFSRPFESLYWGTEFNLATQLVRKLFLFSILGFLFVASFDSRSRSVVGRRSTRLAMLACALLLASAIEVGQLWLPDATPSFSDVVLYLWGTVGGMTVGTKA